MRTKGNKSLIAWSLVSAAYRLASLSSIIITSYLKAVNIFVYVAGNPGDLLSSAATNSCGEVAVSEMVAASSRPSSSADTDNRGEVVVSEMVTVSTGPSLSAESGPPFFPENGSRHEVAASEVVAVSSGPSSSAPSDSRSEMQAVVSMSTSADCCFSDDEERSQSLLDDSILDSDFLPDSSKTAEPLPYLSSFVVSTKKKCRPKSDHDEPHKNFISNAEKSLPLTVVEYSAPDDDKANLTSMQDVVTDGNDVDGLAGRTENGHDVVGVIREVNHKVPVAKKGKKKIPRPCVMCGKMQTNLTRH